MVLLHVAVIGRTDTVGTRVETETCIRFKTSQRTCVLRRKGHVLGPSLLVTIQQQKLFQEKKGKYYP
jgi:hypothetical protein